MIRDRLKSLAHRTAVKVFKMERDLEPHIEPTGRLDRAPQSVDLSVIPRVVDGSGDTPGPNHREDIGRTWLAAQVISGVAPMLIDIRPPQECAAGLLPRAVVMPGDQLKQRLDELPDKALRVVVYDQVGGDEPAKLAAWLREQGWGMARRLSGGYAEWIEHAEPVEVPHAPEGGKWHIGTMVERKGGARAYVQAAWSEGGAPRYRIWRPDGSSEGPLTEADLAG